MDTRLESDLQACREYIEELEQDVRSTEAQASKFAKEIGRLEQQLKVANAKIKYYELACPTYHYSVELTEKQKWLEPQENEDGL